MLTLGRVRAGSRVALVAAVLVGGSAAAEEGAPTGLLAVRPQRPDSVPSDQELEAVGAVVGEISLDRVDVFDPRIPGEDHRFHRLANLLHYRTREKVVRDRLLVHPGDRFSGALLREAERRLRQQRIFFDALIVPVRFVDGIVDLEVVTRDVWSLAGGASFGRKGGANTVHEAHPPPHCPIDTNARASPTTMWPGTRTPKSLPASAIRWVKARLNYEPLASPPQMQNFEPCASASTQTTCGVFSLAGVVWLRNPNH